MLIATICLGVVLGGPGPGVGLLVASCVLVPYLFVSGVSAQRLGSLGLPQAWVRWLSAAVVEEGQELEPAIHPSRAGARDVAVAVLATAVVVGASVAMELTASTFGTRHHIAEIVTGALVLAGVTSLPNAVSALYLAVRGRGAATLSIALNSNAIRRHRWPTTPWGHRRAGSAVGAGNARRRVVSRSDRCDVGMRVCR